LLVNWPHNEANQHAELVRSSRRPPVRS
jgi:hypothetical protein